MDQNLKSIKQLISDIEDLQDKIEGVTNITPNSILSYSLDLDYNTISTEARNDLSDLVEAFKLSVIQVLEADIQNKKQLIKKIQ